MGAGEQVSRLLQRLRSAPVFELVGEDAPGRGVRFRYRRDPTGRAQAGLAAALQSAGYREVSLETGTVGATILATLAEETGDGRADALVNAAIVLGAIAANGLPVPGPVIRNLREDGLPSYIGFAGLWRLELSGIEISMLGPLLEARLARDPDDADAMMDIATLLILTLIPENRAPAFGYQARALERKALYRLPAARQGRTLRLLALASPGDMTAITHLDCLLEDSEVELLVLYARPDRPFPESIPEHDAVFVAIGESGPNRPLLSQASDFARASQRRVFNPPERILELSRDSVSARLRGLPGVVMPVTASVDRGVLEQVARGSLAIETVLEDGAFPLIVRPRDSQGGKDLERIADAAALGAYLGSNPAPEYFISCFVDYRSEDGLFRKYRTVLIAGRSYACHMAISSHWMIHYVNADMDDSADKRAEEASFMREYEQGFGHRHAAALAAIDRRLGLDYFGIDCAETPDGKLLVFEADTAMLVHAMDSTELYPYKLPQMQKLFGAFRAMLAGAVAPAGRSAN